MAAKKLLKAFWLTKLDSNNTLLLKWCRTHPVNIFGILIQNLVCHCHLTLTTPNPFDESATHWSKFMSNQITLQKIVSMIFQLFWLKSNTSNSIWSDAPSHACRTMSHSYVFSLFLLLCRNIKWNMIQEALSIFTLYSLF